MYRILLYKYKRNTWIYANKKWQRITRKQEGPKGPEWLTWEIGKKVTIWKHFLYTVTKEIFM